MNKQRLIFPIVLMFVVLMFVTLPGAVPDQTLPKVYHLGLLGCGPPPSDTGDIVAGLIRGLGQRGYGLDRNVAFERRGAQFHLDRLPELVDELVASRVDVIVAIGYPAAAAAQQGTKTIPIVSAGTPDAIATGLVNSLSRPGGNLTGISDDAVALSAKRLELLKEAVPQLRHVAMLYNAADLGMTQRYQVSALAAQTLGLTVQPLPVREPEGFDEAFAAMTREPPDGLLMVTDALTALNHRRVFEFAAAHRLPAIYEFEALARDGGLMSYGPDMRELQDRVAGLIDRILKGTKPAELPFEQPTRFPFVINLKTAKALGLAIPQSILARADELIE
ncbi:MAG TPA: ABC transporter substrate-binding protein [Stellaceae bacterium]|nr:ABC transporter substrate-binding protein [Stellaceae bacterium]